MNRALISKIQKVETHPDAELQHLSVITVNEKLCISGKEDGNHRYNIDDLVLFCPVGAVIPLDFLKFQGYYWDAEKDRGILKGSKRNRVGSVTRGSVTSEGLLFPTFTDKGITFFKFIENGIPIKINVKEGENLTEMLRITFNA